MHAQLDQQLIKEISAGGNELCVHTYHHYDLSKLKEDGIAKELNETNDILSSILGERFSFFRPPGGQYNQLVLRTARKNHYAMVLWDINPADFVDLENNMPTEPVILAEIIEKLNGSRRARIILLHENMLNTVDALSGIIEYGLSHGFTFTTVSSLKFKPNFKI
jgi:peptidoglycan/xylan/chitin deacetylase (PgdA/CDA1 family)